MDYKKIDELSIYIKKIDERLIRELFLYNYIFNFLHDQYNIPLLKGLSKKEINLDEVLDASKKLFPIIVKDPYNFQNNDEAKNLIYTLSKNCILPCPYHPLLYLEKINYFVRALKNKQLREFLEDVEKYSVISLLNNRLPFIVGNDLTKINNEKVLDLAFNLYESPNMESFLQLLDPIILTEYVRLFDYSLPFKKENEKVIFKRLASKLIFYLYKNGVKSNSPLFKEIEKPNADKHIINEVLEYIKNKNYEELLNKLSILSLQLKVFILPFEFSDKVLERLYLTLLILRDADRKPTKFFIPKDTPMGLYI